MTEARRTLLVMRHAKSAYPQGVVDHDRPLAPRGVREAGLAGDWLRLNAPAIDAVLCSTATRARDTLAHTKATAPVRYCERLYDATSGTVIEEINGVDDAIRTLLLIGHEPAMAQVVLTLAATEATNRKAAEQLSMKYPTSAIAELQVDVPWRQLEPGGAVLVAFHVPR
jgi:phosphohistidine phosphatase